MSRKILQRFPSSKVIDTCPGCDRPVIVQLPVNCTHAASPVSAPVLHTALDCDRLQHLADISADPPTLLAECARVLVPGGRLWLLALNPLAPYRLRWRGQGPRAAEPVTWRRRLRAAGLAPDPISQGIGPTWAMSINGDLQDGAGLRAAFLLRAEKRRIPMTPMRAPRKLRLQPGMPAV